MNELERCFQLAALSPCVKMKFGALACDVQGGLCAVGWNGWYRYGMESDPVPCDPCLRIGVASGTRVELCRALHAEQVAIMHALRGELDLNGGTLYVAGIQADGAPYLKLGRGFYCTLCARMIVGVGIAHVVVPVATEGGWEPAVLTTEEVVEYAYAVATGVILAHTQEKG